MAAKEIATVAAVIPKTALNVAGISLLWHTLKGMKITAAKATILLDAFDPSAVNKPMINPEVAPETKPMRGSICRLELR